MFINLISSFIGYITNNRNNRNIRNHNPTLLDMAGVAQDVVVSVVPEITWSRNEKSGRLEKDEPQEPQVPQQPTFQQRPMFERWSSEIQETTPQPPPAPPPTQPPPQHPVGWSVKNHYMDLGLCWCGQSCPCCRARVGDTLGACEICIAIACK